MSDFNAKGDWLPAKMSLVLPKKVMADFKEECAKRGNLSPAGVVRDLVMCWLIANKDGIDGDAYRKEIQGILDQAKAAAAKVLKQRRHRDIEAWKKKQRNAAARKRTKKRRAAVVKNGEQKEA